MNYTIYIAVMSDKGVLVFTRVFPPKQLPEKTGPFYPKLRPKHFVYLLVEDTNRKPAGDINVILNTDVDGLGFKGDMIRVEKKLARTHMLPSGVAEYASPENITKTEHLRKQNEGRFRQTLSGVRMMKELEGMTVPVPMSPTYKMGLNKTHIKVAFRTCGVELKEDVITLPEEPIIKPGEYQIQVRVNNSDPVTVKIFVYHHYQHHKDASLIPVLPPIWSDDPKYKFDIVEALAEAAKTVQRPSTGWA